MSNHFLASGSSSMKRKKENCNSEKPAKKLMRGLGVAQLESIRLRGEMAAKGYPPSCHYISRYPPPTYTTNEGFRVATAGYSSMSSSSPFAHSTAPPSAASNGGLYHPTAMMGFTGYERANRFRDFQSSKETRWGAGGASNIEGQAFTLPSITTRHLHNLQEEDSVQKKEGRSDSIRSSSQNSGSSGNEEEIDLELRL